MKFRTDRFGELEVPDESLLVLKDGILGFPGDKRFVLLDHDAEGTPFKWLQAVDNPALAFVVMDPCELVPGYASDIASEAADQLECQQTDDLVPMVICHIPHEDPVRTTANLRGPIVVNAATRTGRQIVLKDDTFVFDHPVFGPLEGSPAEPSGPAMVARTV